MFCSVYFVGIDGDRMEYLKHQRLDLYTARQWYSLYSFFVNELKYHFVKLEIVPELNDPF